MTPKPTPAPGPRHSPTVSFQPLMQGPDRQARFVLPGAMTPKPTPAPGPRPSPTVSFQPLMQGRDRQASMAGDEEEDEEQGLITVRGVGNAEAIDEARGDSDGSSGSRMSTKRRLELVGMLNLSYSVAQILGALWFNALGLLSDGFHNLSDVGAVGCALIALRAKGAKPSIERPFGYDRASLVGGFVNSVALVAMSVFVILEAFARLLRPEPTEAGWGFTVIAGAGIIINLTSAAILALSDDQDAMPVCAHSHGSHEHGHSHGSHRHGLACSHSHGKGGLSALQGWNKHLPRCSHDEPKLKDFEFVLCGECAPVDEQCDVEQGGEVSGNEIGDDKDQDHGRSGCEYDIDGESDPLMHRVNTVASTTSIMHSTPAAPTSTRETFEIQAPVSNTGGNNSWFQRSSAAPEGPITCTDANVAAVAYHSLADALTSAVVFVEAIILQGVKSGSGTAGSMAIYLDPLVSICISLFIIYSVKPFVMQCIDVIMDAIPEGIEASDVRAAVERSHPAIHWVSFLGVRGTNIGPPKKGEAISLVRIKLKAGERPSSGVMEEVVNSAKRTLTMFDLENAFVDVEYSE